MLFGVINFYMNLYNIKLPLLRKMKFDICLLCKQTLYHLNKTLT